MTVRLGTASHLNRTAGSMPSLAGHTICGWVLTDLPSDDWATVVYLVVPGNDSHCTIHTRQNGDVLNWRYNYGDTIFTNAIPHGEWFWCGLRFDDDENVTVLVYRPGQDEGVVELGTAGIGPRYQDPIEALWFGDDIWGEPVGSNENPALFRAWRIVPNDADLELERASLTAVAAPIAEWPLDEDADDASGNGYHLTPQGTNLAWVEDEPPIGPSPDPTVTLGMAAHGGGSAALYGTPRAFGHVAARGGGALELEGAPRVLGALAARGGGSVDLGGSPVGAVALEAAGGGAVALEGHPVAQGELSAHGGGYAALSDEQDVTGALAAHGGGSAALEGSPVVTLGMAARGGGSAALTGAPTVTGSARAWGGGALGLSGVPEVVLGMAAHGGGYAALSDAAPPPTWTEAPLHRVLSYPPRARVIAL